MPYNFDELIERKNTDSLKYDFALQRKKPDGLLPMWVADMDFRTPQCVIDALVERSRHGIFGYSESGEAYFLAVQRWYAQHFGWMPKPEWIIKTPGIVFAICAAMRSLTQKGDAVLIQPPVYYPFAACVRDNERKLVENQLVYADGRYSIDFEDFERKIVENDVKMFLLCSPHNPVGRVWTKEELLRLGDICLAHNVIVVSDEIHSDFVYQGRHTVFASLRPEYEQNCIVCTAPSKTFNLAGLQISNIFIPNRDMRRKVWREIYSAGYDQLNTMGMVACKAAYEGGREWLNDLLRYLAGNIAYIRDFLKDLPQIKLVEPEGTYLVWLDCSALNMTDEQLKVFIEQKAGLWLDEGIMFGHGGEGFVRVNIACQRSVVERAFTQLAAAVRGR